MSTHLRNTVSEIKRAYDFHPVPSEETSKIIGFAPVGTYTNGGWTGMVEIFVNKGLGNCNYEENNLKIMRASIRIPSDIVTYDINDKVTTMNVQGNRHDGFLYTVDWYDDDFSRKLECFALSYNPDILNAVVTISKSIDAQ